MKVGVIGAGASGIITAKSLSDEGIDFDVFELSDEVGGTWVYKENFLDKHGYPVASSMYKNLRTNLPKEVMKFGGMEYDVQGISYLKASLVLDYLKGYSNKFSLIDHIKFEHLVVKVLRRESNWELVAKDLSSGNLKSYFYDAIFVCNGHYSVPSYPDIVGAGSFPGTVIHSHYYKVPELFRDKALLIIGCGPSGVDILFDASSYAKVIYFSHHGPENLKTQIQGDNIIHKPDIKAIDGSTVHFMDGTSAQVDSILYCTGYKYDYPFLDKSCEISVDDNYVSPLYKQIVSIRHSTMFFIGIPFLTPLFHLFELQAKCSVNILKGTAKLPTKKEMEQETSEWEECLASKGYGKKRYHMIKDYYKEYFHDIAQVFNVRQYPQVLFDVFEASNMKRLTSVTTFRNEVFSVIDSKTFICE